MPTFPTDSSRFANEFNDAWSLWDSPTPYTKYNEVDLSVLVYGTDPPIGQEIDYPVQTNYLTEDRFWTITVTVEHNIGGDPSINFAWLDDIDSPDGGPEIASGSIYSVDGDDYEITGAKVAACYDSHYSTIDATVTFMQKPVSGDWEIGTITRKWAANGFPTGDHVTGSPVFWDDTGHPDDVEGTDDYHPDIAYDPATNDIHIVWTGYCDDAAYHPFRLNYVHYDYSAKTWDDRKMIYEDEDDYAAWAPRIAIGNAGGNLGEIVGIVYSSYSGQSEHYAQYYWHVGAAYWDADTEGPDDASFFHFSYDDSKDTGFPRLDLAPRNCDSEDGCGSVVFEQSDGGDPPVFGVIEVNNARDDFWVLNISEYGGFFGAVSIHYPDGDPEASLSYFEKISINPWNYWRVNYGRFLLEDDPPDIDWQYVTGPLISGDVSYNNFIDFLTIETFQAGDIVTIDAGTWDNAYWIGYCGAIDQSAANVNVAFGDSTG